MVLLLSASLNAKWPWDHATKTCTIQLSEPAMAGGTLLNAGHYKVEVEDSRVVFIESKSGTRYEAPAAIETAAKKFASTTLTTAAENGRKRIKSIGLGGTTTQVEFP
jgi:hypothetical protein